MLVNGMYAELGKRVSKYYLKDLLVASLMDYYKRIKEEERAVLEKRRMISQIKVLPGMKVVYPEGFQPTV
jgi:replicative superfamily II helicase